eukprot:symbB.v1.2.036619.t1/scaffold5211.1/size29781/2
MPGRPDSACLEKGARLPPKNSGASGTPKSTASAKSGSWSKRLVALERGQRTLAAGTRRALRQALAAQRVVQDAPAPVSQESWEVPGWLDNFLQQEFHDLDGQVSRLSSSLQEAVTRETIPPARSYPSGLHSVRPSVKPFDAAPMHGSCPQELHPMGRSCYMAEKGVDMAEKVDDRDQTLVELMEEAVEEAEMEQLHKAAREEAERLRKELVRVQKLSARTKNKR